MHCIVSAGHLPEYKWLLSVLHRIYFFPNLFFKIIFRSREDKGNMNMICCMYFYILQYTTHGRAKCRL